MPSETTNGDTSNRAKDISKRDESCISPHIWSSITDCLDNAERLLLAAAKIDEERIHNVSYYLAGLALEEIGKADMIATDFSVSHRSQESRWIEKYSLDHVGKLFWALWGPSLGHELITTELLNSFKGLAKHIYDKRLRGLYVDALGEQDILPKDAVTEEEAKILLGLTRARLEIARQWEPHVLTDEKQADLRWYSKATSYPEKRNMILGQKSMEKLVELGDAGAWIHWLRIEFEQADAEAHARTEQELQRLDPPEEEALNPKWQMRIRLYTNSHSIRPKTLNTWNSISNSIKLISVDGKKQQLLVDFNMPKAVLADSLWWVGWGVAHKFITALNIGAMGFFWWYVPEHISRYYEKLTDVEEKLDYSVERSPILKLNWHKDVLSEQELRNTAVCFGMLPGPNDKEKHEPFGHYFTGLGFLGKTDIHMQFEANAYQSFYSALKTGMRIYNDWDEKSPFADTFNRLTCDFITDSSARSRIVQIGESFATDQPVQSEITLSDVGTIKALCDYYFIMTFRRLMEERIQQKEN